jgi:hypothetical protein
MANTPSKKCFGIPAVSLPPAPTEDVWQLRTVGSSADALPGQVIAWIDASGYVYTPRIQCVRTSYTVTSSDVSAGYAAIPVVFPTAFPDANYTLAQGIGRTTAPDNANDYSTGDNHSLTGGGFTAEIYVNSSSAKQGDVVILNTIAIHD